MQMGSRRFLGGSLLFCLISLGTQLCRAQVVPVFVSEAEVNNGGYDSNTSPSITPLPDGTFIVAWHDANGGPTTGWARQYSTNGTPLIPQFSLNPNDGSTWKFGHVVAALPTGGIAAFWSDSSGYTVGQQFGSNFNPVGGEFFNYVNDNWWPAVASSNGNPVLNVNDANSPGGPVMVFLFNSSLMSYQAITANINPPGIGLAPAIAAAPNGNFTPAWYNASGNIIARTFDSNGNPLTGEVTVNSSTTFLRADPSLAYNSVGELWVAWNGNQTGTYQIYLREFAADGTPTGPEFAASQSTSSETAPQLAVGADGTVAVSWTESGSEVYARIFAPDGSPETDEFQVNQYTSGNQLTNWAGGERGTFISETGQYIFTWYGTGAQGDGVYMDVYSPAAGASLSPTSMTFPPELVGTTGQSQSIFLTSTGGQTLTITSITASGDFAESNNCGSSLAAGASCTINVTFTPTQGGNLTGSISISDNAPGSPQTVTLTGTGALGSELAKTATLTVDFCGGSGAGQPAIWRPSNGTWYVHSSSGCSGNLIQIQGQSGDVPVSADYDGDGKSDFAVWQPSNATWYIIPSSNPGAPATIAWGLPDDVPVPADYDGDGVSDIAVWRPGNGTWYILPSDGGAPITKQWGSPGDVPVIGDYDGDGKADYAVFRPSNGTWYVILSSTGQNVTTVWGQPGDIPVEGDYDGDGKTDYAIWRPDTATWYAILSSTGKTISQAWGELGDIPVVGDYNGDGKNDYAIFRPSNATWYIEYSSGGGETIQWGETSDVPATHLPSMYRRDKHIANFDGDRKADIGVFRPSTGTWYAIYSSTGAQVTQAWGESGDIIVPGDYDGDGKTDYAVWRPSTQTWWVVLSSTGKTVTQAWGASGDIPVPGDYDGDGKTDYAIWRPSTGTFWVILSSTGQQVSQAWGTSTDIPVPADYDGDGKTDYAVFRPSTATWYVILSSTGKSVSQPWGVSGDIPVPGDYDGDTKADYTVFRPSNGTWYTLQSSNGKTVTTPFGMNGDIPVAKDYDGDEKTDISVFRPSNATWYILQSSNGQTISTPWGLSTDVPVNEPTGQ